MDASAVLEAPGVASLCSGMLSDRCIRRAIARGLVKAEVSLLLFSILLLLVMPVLYLVLDCGWYVRELDCIGIVRRFCVCLNHADEQNLHHELFLSVVRYF